ncbi:MAG TPA: hypothetical protein VGE16_16290 [Albitalea sp.]
MAERPEREPDAGTAPALPAWAYSMRLTKEQLAAAERTREYHVRKLQSRIPGEHAGDNGARAEH